MTPVTEPSACVTGVNDAFQWRAAPSRPWVVSSGRARGLRRCPGRAGSSETTVSSSRPAARRSSGDRAADELAHRARVEGGEGLVDAYEAQVAVDEGQADRRRGEHGVQQAQGALGAVVQARVVDGQGAALGQRCGEGEIGLRVVAPGAGGEQRHRAEHPASGRQRHDQVRLGRQALDELALMVLDRLVDGGADVGAPGSAHPSGRPGATPRRPPPRAAWRGSRAARPRAPGSE